MQIKKKKLAYSLNNERVPVVELDRGNVVDVVEERDIAAFNVAQELPIEPNIAGSVDPVKHDAQDRAEEIGAQEELLAIPDDTSREKAVARLRRLIEGSFDDKIVRHLHTAPLAIVEVRLAVILIALRRRHNGRDITEFRNPAGIFGAVCGKADRTAVRRAPCSCVSGCRDELRV